MWSVIMYMCAVIGNSQGAETIIHFGTYKNVIKFSAADLVKGILFALFFPIKETKESVFLFGLPLIRPDYF